MSENRTNQEVANGVVRRIQRFLAGLERARRQPNRREAYHICAALEHLHAGRLKQSEDSLLQADRVEPVPPEASGQPGYNETPTVAQLQIALDRVRPK
jgi:hypothetical protein